MRKSEPLEVPDVGVFTFDLEPSFGVQLKAGAIYDWILADLGDTVTPAYEGMVDIFSTLKCVTLTKPDGFDYDKMSLKKEGVQKLLAIWSVYKEKRDGHLKNDESGSKNEPSKPATQQSTGSDAITV